MRNLVAFVAAICLCDVTLAWADIYRCDHDGTLQFSDKPCAAGQEPVVIAQPNTLETSAGDRALAQAFDAETVALHDARARATDQPLAEKRQAQKPRKSRERTNRPTSAKKALKPAKETGAPPAGKLAPPRGGRQRPP
jgi:hypothetical protein